LKLKGLLIGTLILGLSSVNADAAEFVLMDSTLSMDVGDWKVTSQSLGYATNVPFSVEKRRLHGGKQFGVDIVIIDNGEMAVTLVPTRGMGIVDVKMDGKRVLGWESPVKEIVNPAFVDLESRNGLGWLDGFNEVVVRCGYEWTGHPGVDDDGYLLSLHGRIQNTPTSTVKVIIDDAPPHKIAVQGEVSERTFKFSELVTMTEFEVIPGSKTFALHDKLTNSADYDNEYQIIYHSNFGTPILEKGAKIHAAASEVSPFNDYAKGGLKTWQTYLGPTKNYDEMVFNLKPVGDKKGDTLAVLHNSKETQGVAVGYNVNQLPVLTLWKNTDSKQQGYVTGIEPGTSYAYNTKYQRPLGLVPLIKAGETKSFDLTYTVLTDQKEIKTAVKRVEKLLNGKSVKQVEKSIVELNNVKE